MKNTKLAYDRIRILLLRSDDVLDVLMKVDKQLTVTEIIARLRKGRMVEQPEVSRFLRDCREVGLVIFEEKGKNVLYSANKELIYKCINASKKI